MLTIYFYIQIGCSLFLDGDRDIFELSVMQSILPFMHPFNIAFFHTIETTQKFLLDSDGPTSNMVCISDAQTAGRGKIE